MSMGQFGGLNTHALSVIWDVLDYMKPPLKALLEAPRFTQVSKRLETCLNIVGRMAWLPRLHHNGNWGSSTQQEHIYIYILLPQST